MESRPKRVSAGTDTLLDAEMEGTRSTNTSSVLPSISTSSTQCGSSLEGGFGFSTTEPHIPTKQAGPVHDPKAQHLRDSLKQKILDFFQLPEDIETNFEVQLDLEKLKCSVQETEQALALSVKSNEVLRKAKLSN